MRFFAITLALVVLALGVFAGTEEDNAAKCLKAVGKDYANGINVFCARQNIVVPSDYARTGLVYGKAYLNIDGACTPPQWVPSYWCKANFHAICAKYGKALTGSGAQGWYGNNNKCQRFVLMPKAFRKE